MTDIMTDLELVTLSRYVAAGICIGFGAIGAGIGEGYTAGRACEAISRQKSASGDLVKTMLVGQAICESSSIFALVVAIMLVFTLPPVFGVNAAAALLGAGISMGLGALGPGIGAGYASGKACFGIGRHPQSSNVVTGGMLIGQAVSQTSSIFALVVSFLLLLQPWEGSNIVMACALLGAGIAMGAGAIGPGIGTGLAAGEACEGMSRFPKLSGVLTRTMLLGQAVSQSTSIYAMVIAFILMYV